MDAFRELRLLAEDHREMLQPGEILGQLPTTDRGTGLAVGALLGIGEVYRTVLGELGGQHHIKQSALPLGPDHRHTAQWRTDLALGTDHPQVAGALGHQHSLAAWQKGQGPGVAQTFGNRADRQLPLLAGQALFRGRLGQQGYQGEGGQPGSTVHARFLPVGLRARVGYHAAAE